MSDILFRSKDVLLITGISPRQLQHWDEQGLVSPGHDGRNRVYTFKQTLMLMIINSLLDTGMRFMELPGVIPTMKQRLWAVKDGIGTYLLLMRDGRSAFYRHAHTLVFALSDSESQPCWVIDLTPLWTRLQEHSSNGAAK